MSCSAGTLNSSTDLAVKNAQPCYTAKTRSSRATMLTWRPSETMEGGSALGGGGALKEKAGYLIITLLFIYYFITICMLDYCNLIKHVIITYLYMRLILKPESKMYWRWLWR